MESVYWLPRGVFVPLGQPHSSVEIRIMKNFVNQGRVACTLHKGLISRISAAYTHTVQPNRTLYRIHHISDRQREGLLRIKCVIYGTLFRHILKQKSLATQNLVGILCIIKIPVLKTE